MPYTPLLTAPEIARGLDGLPNWRRDGETLVRTVRMATFRDSIALVNRVADAADEADHHPDFEISWRNVTFTLTTKAAHGLTAKDVAMAARIDGLVAEAGR